MLSGLYESCPFSSVILLEELQVKDCPSRNVSFFLRRVLNDNGTMLLVRFVKFFSRFQDGLFLSPLFHLSLCEISLNHKTGWNDWA